MLRKAVAIHLCSIIATFAIIVGALSFASPANASLQKLVYQVRHANYGRIGTYTNLIEKNGDQTTVTTQGRIRVSILGIVLYRQEFDRVERWVGDRLVSFKGKTTLNGRSTEVKGEAAGNNFAVSSPNGTFIAPADLKVANPWSADLLNGDTMLTPDRGSLESVKIRPAETTSLPIKGTKVRARRYEIARPSGERRYEIWVDEEGTPVMFNMNGRGGLVTFTLTS